MENGEFLGTRVGDSRPFACTNFLLWFTCLHRLSWWRGKLIKVVDSCILPLRVLLIGFVFCMTKESSMEFLVAFCKRRGFVFPSSEIYGGLAGVYDYGHYGTLLHHNIRDLWWHSMIQLRDDVVGLDSAIFTHPRTWLASGHVDGFHDPKVDCRDCKNRFRADHILEEFGIEADKASIEFINEQLGLLRKDAKLICPVCGKNNLTDAKVFSLMVKSNFGSPTDALSEENVVYLRPETCGGIYLDYKNVLASNRVKLPFGIAQIGKAFRNEIVARQFVFRTREFEQMEMQYFHHPNQTEEKYEHWRQIRWQWYKELGIPEEKLRWYQHQKLAHYASQAYDIEYDFSCFRGFKEVEGIHARGNWDLSQHGKFSGENMEYFDDRTGERFIPHIMETSVGIGRLFLMVLDNALVEETLENGDKRTVLKIDKKLAPVKIAIFPLLKNRDELTRQARELFENFRTRWMCEYDDNGNVGKRYRRQDEIGTPYCVTIDFETIEEGTVTVRNRDTMTQERVSLDQLRDFFQERL